MSDQGNFEARHKESWIAGCGQAGCTICIPQVGRKDDTGKAPFSLLPWAGVQQILKVLAYGAKKYAPENWRKVPDGRRRYFDAALRHLTAWYGGEDLDPESGLLHLAHAGCCVLFFAGVERNRCQKVKLKIFTQSVQKCTRMGTAFVRA